MAIVQLKISNDVNKLKYISIIRKFDRSLSIGELKQKIDNNDFVIEYDILKYDISEYLKEIDRKEQIANLVNDLIKAGAKLEIYFDGDELSLEMFYNYLNRLREIELEVEEDIEQETAE